MNKKKLKRKLKKIYNNIEIETKKSNDILYVSIELDDYININMRISYFDRKYCYGELYKKIRTLKGTK